MHTRANVSTRARLAGGAGLLAALLLLTGCSGTDDTPKNSTVSTSFSESKLGKQSRWVVDQLNAKSPLDAADWKEKLSPGLTDKMPAKDLVTILNADARIHAPLTLKTFEESGNTATFNVTGKDKKQVKFTLSVDDAGLVSGIHFAPITG